MASAGVVEIFNVVGYRQMPLDYGAPGFMVEQFRSHSSPALFDLGAWHGHLRLVRLM